MTTNTVEFEVKIDTDTCDLIKVSENTLGFLDNEDDKVWDND